MNHLYKSIDLCIKRFAISASSEYSLAPCWLILPPGSKPAFIKAIALPDSLYCLVNDLQDAHVILLKHTHIAEHLNKNCQLNIQYAIKFWTFVSKLIVKKHNILSSFIIKPTLHSDYFQLNLIDRNI